MAATQSAAVKLTYEDYRTTPDDERYELIDGDLIMVAAPNLKHQDVEMELSTYLNVFIKANELGKLLSAPCDVVLSDRDVVQPDLMFISRARAHLLSNGENVQGAPDLVIEILSPSSRDHDLVIKHDLYSRYGVREYWVIDPLAETVAVHRHQQGRLALIRTFARRDTLQSPLLPGLELRLEEIFPH